MSGYQNIKIWALDDIKAVRTRPGMYVGDPTEGPHQMGLALLQWLTALIGKMPQRQVRLCLSSDGAYTFEVLGQGLPERIEEAAELLTTLCAGSGSHNISIIASLNLLSRWFVFKNWSQGIQQHLHFEDGLLTQQTEEPGSHPDGFCISFLPDLLIFPAPTPDSDRIMIERVCDLASVPGLDVIVEIEGAPIQQISALHHTETIQRFCTEEAFFSEMLSLSGVKENITVETTLSWTRSPNEATLSFCNGYQTLDGGTHRVGLRAGLKRAILEYAAERSVLLPEKADCRRGLACVVSVVMAQPMFGGQARDKLVSADARHAVEPIVYEGVSRFLREHPNEAIALLKHLSVTQSTHSTRIKIPIPELPARVLSAEYDNQRSDALQRMLRIAEDPNSPSEQLMMVASCLAPEVGRALAQNPSIPIRLLHWVACDFPDEVLQNPLIPLLWLSEPDWPLGGSGLAALASSAFAPEALLILAAESWDINAKEAVWNNPRTPKELRRRLSQDRKLRSHLRRKRAEQKASNTHTA